MKKEDEQLLTNSKQVVQQKIMEFIIKVVQNYYKVDEDYFSRKTRRNEIIHPRQVAMYLTKKNTTLSLNFIGKMFGNRDHATIINANNKIQGFVDVDKGVKKEISDIQKIISLKGSSALNGYKLNDVFYFIDLSNFESLRFGEHKTVLLTGFSDDEISEIKATINGLTESRRHTNTGIYILENRQENGKKSIKKN